ncbi:MAG: uroporphyrinogen decarboxylase [Alphaproteobacteria bacterium]
MRQAGRYLPEYRAVRQRAGGFLDLCFTPELAAEVTLQPVRRFALDAAILFSDILVIPLALGQGVRFTESEGPWLDPLADGEAIARLSSSSVEGRLAPVYEAISRIAAEMAPEVALIGFAGAPWTLASYMLEGRTSQDFAAAKLFAFRQPGEFQRLLDVLVEAVAGHLVRQVAAGVEALQIFDSWAGVLGECEFERWCVEPIRRIVERVRESCPAVPIIAFPRGAGVGYHRVVEHSGIDGISLDPSVPLAWAAEVLRPGAVLQGNLDPLLLVAGGDAMRQAAGRILHGWGQGPFIFNLGHGVPQTTPPDHVAQLVEIVHGWRSHA